MSFHLHFQSKERERNREVFFFVCWKLETLRTEKPGDDDWACGEDVTPGLNFLSFPGLCVCRNLLFSFIPSLPTALRIQ